MEKRLCVCSRGPDRLNTPGSPQSCHSRVDVAIAFAAASLPSTWFYFSEPVVGRMGINPESEIKEKDLVVLILWVRRDNTCL